jgi:hypothetical protein
LHNELLVGLKVVDASPFVAWREVSVVQTLSLVEQTVFVSLSQWIGGTPNVVNDCVIVSLGDGRAEAEN